MSRLVGVQRTAPARSNMIKASVLAAAKVDRGERRYEIKRRPLLPPRPAQSGCNDLAACPTAATAATPAKARIGSHQPGPGLETTTFSASAHAASVHLALWSRGSRASPAVLVPLMGVAAPFGPRP